VLVVGGGINGVGIARDAAGRGLSVMLAERSDLAGATSSASSKLVHGGLRYLEQYQFRLVRESLAEREVLLSAAPHLIWPLRFVLPLHAGLRPAWLLRLGLLLYDHIGGRETLPATRSVRRDRDPELAPLKDSYRRGFEYSDCWADDARLVVANAMDARNRGARIDVGWWVTAANRDGGRWRVELASEVGLHRTVYARALVNAAGPWVEDVLRATGSQRRSTLRLVKGSHIVVRRLYPEPQAYTLQSGDGRVVFIVPYENDFTLIGTTDIAFAGDPTHVSASMAEITYLCGVVTDYLRAPVTPEDVVWSYAGVRPLYDDGHQSASTVTRDYAFDLNVSEGVPLLSVFGGKLTTYRKLAEHALSELLPTLGLSTTPWTRGAILPGGDVPGGDFEAFSRDQVMRHGSLPPALVKRLCRAYGTQVERILGGGGRGAGSGMGEAAPDLGREIAPQLYEAELDYLYDQEWAHTADAVLWRRSKLGLRYDAAETAAVEAWFSERRTTAPRS
jgi:glycerol-3-phosphate dehydrogenase